VNIRTALLGAVLLASLSSCASNNTETSGVAYAPAETLASYRTYAWSPKRSLNLQDPSHNTTTTRSWIENAVDADLAAKGFTKSNGSAADVLVNYTAGSRTVFSSQNFRLEDEWSHADQQKEGDTGAALAPNKTLDTNYEEGRLNLEIIDRKSGKTAFRGSTKTALLSNPSPSKSIPRINRFVKDMLKDFPGR
jgi:hypothetical protein